MRRLFDRRKKGAKRRAQEKTQGKAELEHDFVFL